MTETLAYPPKPSRPAPAPAADTHAATMMAPPVAPPAKPAAPPIKPSMQATMAAEPKPKPAVPESSQPTLAAEITVDDSTLMADGLTGSGARKTLNPGQTRGPVTVLPDVRSEGDRLVMVPRDQTRYQSDKLLGRGGMGEVKLARDHDIGRKVALKRLLDEDNPHAVARFIDEVRTVGSLEHPNIVPIHDVGVDEDGALFFVMKYVEGETLESIIEKLAAGDAAYHKRFPFEARLDLFTGLLRALQYAHSQGLVHRDIKPANIMVGQYGEVVLMDWGIAHRMRSEERKGTLVDIERASTETMDGALVGTPQYMSPEQAMGEAATLDGRSDLYSAGVVLFELLTLRPYVEPGATAMQTLVAAQQRRPPTPIDAVYNHPHQDAVPVELRHFLKHLLAHDKNERYGDADEVLYTLENVRAGNCMVECPITFMKANNAKMGRFMDRHPGASMTLLSVSLLAFLGGLAGWAMWLI